MKKFNLTLILLFIITVAFSSCNSNIFKNDIPSTTAPIVSIVESSNEITTLKTKETIYVKSIHSNKFHSTDCFWVQKILDKNKIYSKTRKQFIDCGYSPCEECRP